MSERKWLKFKTGVVFTDAELEAALDERSVALEGARARGAWAATVSRRTFEILYPEDLAVQIAGPALEGPAK